MRFVPPAALALAILGACAAAPPGRALTTYDCPKDSDLNLESTVEGKDTWWPGRKPFAVSNPIFFGD